jgi:uncharacterized protein YxjI
MKQKLFAFGDDFHIKDESGRDKFSKHPATSPTTSIR